MVKCKNILNTLIQFLHLRTASQIVCKVLENAFPLFFRDVKNCVHSQRFIFLPNVQQCTFSCYEVAKDVNNNFATEDIIRKNIVQEHTQIPPSLNNEDMLY